LSHFMMLGCREAIKESANPNSLCPKGMTVNAINPPSKKTKNIPYLDRTECRGPIISHANDSIRKSACLHHGKNGTPCVDRRKAHFRPQSSALLRRSRGRYSECKASSNSAILTLAVLVQTTAGVTRLGASRRHRKTSRLVSDWSHVFTINI